MSKVRKSTEISQDSIDLRPSKRAKLDSSDFSVFSLIQSQKEDIEKIIIKKNDNIKKSIDKLITRMEIKKQIIIMSSGASIQKQISIIEILKKKLNSLNLKYKQYNKLDKFEIINSKNELLNKKLNVPVFYCLIKIDNLDEELKDWTENI